MISLQSTHEEVIQEMHRLRELYTLKHTLRYESKRADEEHSESVAEHLFGMYVLVEYFLSLEDPEDRLDARRIHELILYHELGEIETGDLISHKKTPAHVEEERRAAQRVASRLPEHLRERALLRYEEFENKSSPEADFAEAVDKLEPIFEMLPQERWKYYRKQNMNKTISIGKKLRAAERYPYMKLFLEAWTELMAKNRVFADD